MAPQTALEQWLVRLAEAGLGVSSHTAPWLPDGASVRSFDDLLTLLRERNVLTPWQIEQLRAGRRSFLVGKYRLLRPLGRGGMGEVYLAEHLTMGRRVAIKMIPRDLPPPALERFLVEVRTLAALDHPNIVHAYNVDLDEGRYYLVMEYVEGEDLERFVGRRGRLGWRNAVEIVRQAATGLAHAHEKGFVHCDIKPANLIITPQGVVKILDLGLARLRGPSQDAGAPEGSVIGTVDYMAPELALDPQHVDPRADIYSLGCVLFFCLVGQPPFAGGTLAERIVKHQTQPPPDLQHLRPDVPDTLAEICRRMLAKSPGERFPTASEVARALKHCEESSSSLLIRARALPEDGSSPQPRPKAPVQTEGEKGPEAGQSGSRPDTPEKGDGEQKKSVALKVPRPFRRAILGALITGGLCLFLLLVWAVFQKVQTTPEKPAGQRPASPPEQQTLRSPRPRPADDPEEFRRGIEEWMRSQATKSASPSRSSSTSPGRKTPSKQ